MSDRATLLRLLHEHSYADSTEKAVIAEESISRLFDSVKDELYAEVDALRSRAEKAEAKVKELREELDKDNSYFEDIYTALEMEDFAPSCIPEINKLKGRNFELEQSVIELESSLAALREQTRWIPVGERLPEIDTLILTFDSDGDIKSDFRSFNPICDNVTHWRPIDLPEIDKEGME